MERDIFALPWGHHKLIMDKFLKEPQKALFYVHQTVENGWSRNMLHNFIDTDLFERQGKALTNFKHILPAVDSHLAQELTKDPYGFGFAGVTKPYNEAVLKNALLDTISPDFLRNWVRDLHTLARSIGCKSEKRKTSSICFSIILRFRVTWS